MSTSPFNGRSRYEEQVQHHNARLPPWEQRQRDNVVQVPFMNQTTPPLSQTEQQALTSLWASKMVDRDLHGQHIRDLAPANETARPRYYSDREAIPAAPMTAPPPGLESLPYESYKILQGPRTAPHLPAFVKGGPPTPPKDDTISRSSTKSSRNPGSHETSPIPGPPVTTVPALPGTMFTREQEHVHGRSRSLDSNNEKAESQGFGKRFRSSLRNMFKREPFNEADFERIEDRHWSEE